MIIQLKRDNDYRQEIIISTEKFIVIRKFSNEIVITSNVRSHQFKLIRRAYKKRVADRRPKCRNVWVDC